MTPIANSAEEFRSLHVKGAPLVLPNAWDVASARLVEEAGARAVATTSAGVAWSLGAADGNRVDPALAIQLVARIASAVRLPVTADIEGGYADTVDGLAATIRAIADVGAVGVNLEDSSPAGPAGLLPMAEQCRRIEAARRAADDVGTRLFVNARTDVFLHAGGDQRRALDDAQARLAAYVEAGADGVYPIGLSDLDAIATLAESVAAPLNVLVGPGGHSVGELGRLGVARVSVGPALAAAAYAVVRRGARELLTGGTCAALADALSFGELNALLRDGPGEARMARY